MLSKDELDKLRAEHPGGITHVIGKDNRWECVFRAPTRSEYKMFRGACHVPSRVADANEVLARQTVVFPPPAAFDALLDRFPAIPEAMASDPDFRALMGISVEEAGKA